MTNKPNLYFFRDREGYKPDEIEERIQVDDLRARPEPVKSVLEDAGLEKSVLDERKGRILDQIQENVSDQRYERFLYELLDERGELGDKPNLQMYKLPDVEHDGVINELEKTEDGNDIDDNLLKRVEDYRELDEKSGIDIKFVVPDVGDYFSQDELEVIGSGDKKAVSFNKVLMKLEETDLLEELGMENINALREKSELAVEARIYTESDLLFVSNRKIWDSLQTDIRDKISEWGGSTAPTGNIELKGTELLYLQNVMSGENSGLDYGGFLDNRLKTAKYRGPRQESLTRSPVLEPAQTEGEITQVRFYYPYSDWTVQIRIHDDCHLTTTKPTEPDFIDEIESHLERIFNYRYYLTPIDDRITEFAGKKQRIKSRFNERNYRKTRRKAFKKIVDNYIHDDTYNESEKEVYGAVIANILIRLGHLNLDSSQYPDPADLEKEDYPEKQRELESFYEDYFSLSLEEAPPDFVTLWHHLQHTFTNLFAQPTDSPHNLVDSVHSEYDIRI